MATRVATKDEIKALQRLLAERGLYAGTIDGLFGPRSREAVRTVQRDLGHEVTGLPTLKLLVELGIVARPAPNVSLRSVLRVLRPRRQTGPTAGVWRSVPSPRRRGSGPAARARNPISDFFTGLLVRKGAELLSSNLQGHPIMTMLSGYKTYILAILILLSALSENFLGVDVPGFSMGLGEAFAVGLALITGRAGAKADAAKAAGQ